MKLLTYLRRHSVLPLALVPIMLFIADSTTAQRTPFGAELALQAVREDLDSLFPEPLSVSRLPALTENIIYTSLQLSTTASKDSVPLIWFYEVTPSRYELSGNRVTGTYMILDGKPKWVVAVDKETESVYRLFGFGSETRLQHCIRLVERLDLEITDEAGARTLFSLILRLIYGEKHRSGIVMDPFHLEAVAGLDFRKRCSRGSAPSIFRDWWEGPADPILSALRRPRLERRGERFVVQYHRYGRGKVLKESLEINADGTFKLDPSRVLVERPKEGPCEWDLN